LKNPNETLGFGAGTGAFRLLPKRRPWMSEDSRMNIFDAVALGLVFRLKQAKRPL
jgi:hypothetical protein